ncbi:3-hydroxybutyryl-CoA dehydrogenase [Aeromicrobium sp.]|uniref:3-hydroxybutyryl-CoA dehydrogenase n=2 Tax=Aeromicrobium sp. TaxID=1871063 RepID=UPI003510EE2E
MSDPLAIGVLGGGLMGSGIAEVCARAGHDVLLVEADASARDGGRDRVAASVSRAVERGKLTSSEAQQVLGRIRVGLDLDACADRDLVVEAVTEREDVKATVLARVDKVLADEALLASNTSSLPIMRLAAATSRPDRVIGLHFFNPVPVMPVVEVVTALTTSNDTLSRAEAFVRDSLGKHVVRASDRAGFVVNAMLVPYLLSAVRMLESGYATARDIDEGMRLGCGHPMGPLALCDLIGLDTVQAIAESMYAEYKEPLYAPPPLLQRMTDAGLLGRKSGRGFHPSPAAA